jgi:hypothetical protein
MGVYVMALRFRFEEKRPVHLVLHSHLDLHLLLPAASASLSSSSPAPVGSLWAARCNDHLSINLFRDRRFVEIFSLHVGQVTSDEAAPLHFTIGEGVTLFTLHQDIQDITRCRIGSLPETSTQTRLSRICMRLFPT